MQSDQINVAFMELFELCNIKRCKHSIESDWISITMTLEWVPLLSDDYTFYVHNASVDILNGVIFVQLC